MKLGPLTLKDEHRLTVRENYTMGNFIICIIRHTFWGDKLKENEVGKSCSTHGRHEECTEILVGRTKWIRALAKPKYRWVDEEAVCRHDKAPTYYVIVMMIVSTCTDNLEP